jgi:ribosomal protein S18 acetylase RimI-like enzyme
LHPLDNPIWNALNSEDKNKNQGNETVAIFYPEISPFVGLENWSSASQQELVAQIPISRTCSTLIASPFVVDSNWDLVFSLTLYQLVCSSLKPYNGKQAQIKPLGDEDIPAMLALTALTKPGPFTQRTIDFGNYVGIFDKQQLVAMAGERLHLTNYTEVSAVCTHPDYVGKGYAALLVHHLTDQIIKSGRTAFLHVRQDNDRAIQLYQGLGFEIRSDMYFAVIKPKASAEPDASL